MINYKHVEVFIVDFSLIIIILYIYIYIWVLLTSAPGHWLRNNKINGFHLIYFNYNEKIVNLIKINAAINTVNYNDDPSTHSTRYLFVNFFNHFFSFKRIHGKAYTQISFFLP